MNQQTFHEMVVQPFIARAIDVRGSIERYIRDEYNGSLRRRKGVLGLSGGIDSALVAALLKSSGMPFVVALLPDGDQVNVKDSSQLMLDYLQKDESDVFHLDISPMLDARCAVCKEQYLGSDQCLLCRGNRAARQRMIELYDIARQVGGVVIGTENLTEHYLGYFTLHGDAASDFEPIRGLVKEEVKLLAGTFPGFPQQIIDQRPSANLWLGQTDEGELGFTYREADAYILSNGDLSVADRLEIDHRIWCKIGRRISDTSFKRQGKPVWNMPHRLIDIL